MTQADPTTPGQTGTDQTFAPGIMGTFRAGVTVLESGVVGLRREWNNLINAFLLRVREALEADQWWEKLGEWITDDIRDGLARIDLSPASAALFNWRGPAHEAYKSRVQDQGDAVGAVVDKVKATSLWLADVAQANTAYIVELADRVAELVGVLVSIVSDVGEAAVGDIPAVQQGTSPVRVLRSMRHSARAVPDQPRQSAGRRPAEDHRAGRGVRRPHRSAAGQMAAGGQRMRGVVVASGMLAAVAVLAGCSEVDTSPIDSGIPDASSSAATRSLPTPGGHWKGFGSKCPQLTSGAAGQVGADNPGTPTDQYATSAAVTNADCHWGSTDGRGGAVNARISVWARQEAADAQWQTLSAGQTQPIQVGDEGFVIDEGDAVVVRTRSGNAVAVVRIVAAADAPDKTRPREAACEITEDVLDDLVPG